MGQEISTRATSTADGSSDVLLSCLFSKKQINEILKYFVEANSPTTRLGGKLQLDLRTFPSVKSTLQTTNVYNFKPTGEWLVPLSLVFSAYTVASEAIWLEKLSTTRNNALKVNTETSARTEGIQQLLVSMEQEINAYAGEVAGWHENKTGGDGVEFWPTGNDIKRNLASISDRIAELLLTIGKEMNVIQKTDAGRIVRLVGAGILAPIQIGIPLGSTNECLFPVGLMLAILYICTAIGVTVCNIESDDKNAKTLKELNLTLNYLVKLETKFLELDRRFQANWACINDGPL